MLPSRYFLLIMPNEASSHPVPDPVSASDSGLRGGHTRIHPVFRAALLHGAEKLVRSFLQSGSDIESKDVRGLSPLMLAASRGHLNICMLLLEAGADVHARTIDGHDAAAIANVNGHYPLAAFLRPDIRPGQDPPAPVFAGEFSGIAAEADEIPAEDLSGWIGETMPDGLPQVGVTQGARNLNSRLSEHIPVDNDADWSDIAVDLPGRRRAVSRAPAGSPAARVRFAADELTERDGTPASLTDVMGHSATRGMIYRTIRAEYMKWRESLDEQHAVHSNPRNSAAAVQENIPDSGRNPVLHSIKVAQAPDAYAVTGGNANRSQASAGNAPDIPDTATANPNQPGGIQVPVRKPDVPDRARGVFSKLWLAADELRARDGVPPTVGDLMRHPATRGMVYRNIRAQYLKWLAAYNADAGISGQCMPEQQDVPVTPLPEPAGRDGIITPAGAGVSANAATHKGDETTQHRFPEPGEARKPPPPYARWDEVATYLAECASLSVNDTRGGNGYLWILVSSVDTDELRALARKLLFMGFQHVAGLGFRRK